LYFLTEKGIWLTPLIMELWLWSDRFVRDEHPGLYFWEDTKALKNDKIWFTDTLINNYKNIIQ
jgi:DNA-binding HxlR family transcriptional regulator